MLKILKHITPQHEISGNILTSSGRWQDFFHVTLCRHEEITRDDSRSDHHRHLVVVWQQWRRCHGIRVSLVERQSQRRCLGVIDGPGDRRVQTPALAGIRPWRRLPQHQCAQNNVKQLSSLLLYYYYKGVGWWRWVLDSPDGVAYSRMVSVSASVNLPLRHKVQKFSSGTGSPGWSRKKGRKTVVVWYNKGIHCRQQCVS